MKIAMIGQKGIVTSQQAGGIERHVREISKRLALIGHDIFVYARAKYDPSKNLEFDGVKLIYLPTIYTKHAEAIIHTFICAVHACFQNYDIIHFHGVGPSTLAWIPRLFSRNSKVIVTFHSQDRFHKKWGFVAQMYLWFGEWTSVAFSHYCIAVSHEMQVYCREHYSREVIYIPNGSDVKSVSAHDELHKFGLNKQEYFLNVGRIVPQKGLHFLIKAFRKLKTDKHLVIVGAPSFSEKYYTQLIDLARGDERIHFVGFQEGIVLEQLYANAFAYVHPSEYEGLPLVLLEAMSYGLMPIVSDIAPNIEIIHGIGLTFMVADVDDLNRQLEYAIAHPQIVRDQSNQAKSIIEEYFNWDTITDHIESVYITARH
jgi:glycosyltransferase involved in cell wall biosynthesis